MLTAITREVSPNLTSCELTHLPREPIDVKRAAQQHRAYADGLARLGCKVVTLPADPAYPDSVFVEDVAIVLDELAVITRPGADSRRGERTSIEHALKPYRQIERIESPATLDGGDVMIAGRTLFIGVSARTSEQGVEQLRDRVQQFGYSVQPVAVTGCLHLKSACTCIDDALILINRDWVDAAPFAGFDFVDVDPREPGAANGLRVGETVIYPACFPRTHARLEARGLAVEAVDISELMKAESAVTCSSLVFEA